MCSLIILHNVSKCDQIMFTISRFNHVHRTVVIVEAYCRCDDENY